MYALCENNNEIFSDNGLPPPRTDLCRLDINIKIQIDFSQFITILKFNYNITSKIKLILIRQFNPTAQSFIPLCRRKAFQPGCRKKR